MIILIVFVLVLIIVAYCYASESCLMFFLGAVLILGLIAGSVSLNDSVCDIPAEEVTPLYAGYNDSEINGTFFLGTGAVDEKEMVYYWVDDNGIKFKQSLLMDKSVFIEDGQNVLIKRYYDCPEKWSWLLTEINYGSYEFHVPENSIGQMFQYH